MLRAHESKLAVQLCGGQSVEGSTVYFPFMLLLLTFAYTYVYVYSKIFNWLDVYLYNTYAKIKDCFAYILNFSKFHYVSSFGIGIPPLYFRRILSFK